MHKKSREMDGWGSYSDHSADSIPTPFKYKKKKRKRKKEKEKRKFSHFRRGLTLRFF